MKRIASLLAVSFLALGGLGLSVHGHHRGPAVDCHIGQPCLPCPPLC